MFWTDTFESVESYALFLGLFKPALSKPLKKSVKGVKDLRLPEDKKVEPQLNLVSMSYVAEIHPRTPTPDPRYTPKIDTPVSPEGSSKIYSPVFGKYI